MAWVGVIQYGKYNYYEFIIFIRQCVRGEFVQNYFNIFNFLLICSKNFGSHTGWPAAKRLGYVTEFYMLYIHVMCNIYLYICMCKRLDCINSQRKCDKETCFSTVK